MDSTITEHDLDAATQSFARSLGSDNFDIENDLSVDGLSESLMSRIFSLFMFRRS